MAGFLRLLVRALVWMLVMMVGGVLLGLGAELLAMVDRLRDSSGLLGYAVWFVSGVFCAVFIYGPELDRDPASPEGRRRGRRLMFATGAAALVFGGVAALFWSGGGLIEPVVPDHRGMTLAYLATIVATVALAHFVVFAPASPASTVDTEASKATPPARARSRFVPDSRWTPRPAKAADDAEGEFRPAGFWKTVGLAVGVPLLLFLDAAVFVLAPYDFFDRWTGPILGTALIGGLAWGLAAARLEWPRIVLAGMHIPLIAGSMFYVFGVIAGGILAAFGVGDGAAGAIGPIAFWIGLALGCGPFVMGAWDILRNFRRDGRKLRA